MEKKRGDKVLEKIRKNPWIISTLVILLVILLFVMTSGKTSLNVVSEKEASTIVSEFVGSQLPEEIIVQNITSENGLYKINVVYEEKHFPVYLTMDGKNFVQGLVPFEQIISNSENKSISGNSTQ